MLSLQQFQEGKKELKKTPPKKPRAPSPPSAWEQAILSCRPAIETEEEDDEEDPELWPEWEDQEMEGSGFGKVIDNMIH